MKKIALFDPSLHDSKGNHSFNLGDIIIYESIKKFFDEYFDTFDIVRIPTHTYINKKHRKIINESELVFVGGTNLLSSNILKYNQWKLNKYYNLFNTIQKTILLGVGWWQYQKKADWITKYYYKSILSKDLLHSVRDSYTENMLKRIDIANILNTSCPTVWDLNGMDFDKKVNHNFDVLFMLTDYMPDIDSDNKLIEILLDNFKGKVYFFPQGRKDIEYFQSLDSYKKNSSRFIVLSRSISDLDKLIMNNESLIYIGTRLHGGIKCLQNNIPSLILSIDNRSQEIKKDINLPVVMRTETEMILSWIQNDISLGKIKLPVNEIEKWKSQFDIYK